MRLPKYGNRLNMIVVILILIGLFIPKTRTIVTISMSKNPVRAGANSDVEIVCEVYEEEFDESYEEEEEDDDEIGNLEELTEEEKKAMKQSKKDKKEEATTVAKKDEATDKKKKEEDEKKKAAKKKRRRRWAAEANTYIWCPVGENKISFGRCGGDCQVYNSIKRLSGIICNVNISRSRVVIRWKPLFFIPEMEGTWGCEYKEEFANLTLKVKDNAALLGIASSHLSPIPARTDVEFICEAVNTLHSADEEFVWTHVRKVGSPTEYEGIRIGNFTSVLRISQIMVRDSGEIYCALKHSKQNVSRLFTVLEKVSAQVITRDPGCFSCPYIGSCQKRNCPKIVRLDQLFHPVGCSVKCPRPIGVLDCIYRNASPTWSPIDPCFTSSLGSVSNVEKVNYNVMRTILIVLLSIFVCVLLLISTMLFCPSVGRAIIYVIRIIFCCRKKKPKFNPNLYNINFQKEANADDPDANKKKTLADTICPCLKHMNDEDYEFDAEEDQEEEKTGMAKLFAFMKGKKKPKAEKEEEEEEEPEEDVNALKEPVSDIIARTKRKLPKDEVKELKADNEQPFLEKIFPCLKKNPPAEEETEAEEEEAVDGEVGGVPEPDPEAVLAEEIKKKKSKNKLTKKKKKKDAA